METADLPITNSTVALADPWSAGPLTPWRDDQDPFAGRLPLPDLTPLIGGLPDERSAEEILADLKAGRAQPSWPKAQGP